MNYNYIDCNGISVARQYYLDGGGSDFGRQFVPFVKKHIGRVERVCEFCAGCGFIGFDLLAAGLCSSLCLVDVNPDALEAMEETIRLNKIENVSLYLSDGLRSVPSAEKWDLVVSNPPWAKGFYEPWKEIPPILWLDEDWSLHRHFYNSIHRHLKRSGMTLFLEDSANSSAEDWLPMLKQLKFHRDVPLGKNSGFYFFWCKRDLNLL